MKKKKGWNFLSGKNETILLPSVEVVQWAIREENLSENQIVEKLGKMYDYGYFEIFKKDIDNKKNNFISVDDKNFLSNLYAIRLFEIADRNVINAKRTFTSIPRDISIISNEFYRLFSRIADLYFSPFDNKFDVDVLSNSPEYLLLTELTLEFQQVSFHF